ncbi:MAG: ABC transporter permease [Planctomycetes bacterium]|nr:ABC transporter permease [Planctomycetota bacterium]
MTGPTSRAEPGPMAALVGIARSGGVAVTLHPLRSVVTVAALVAMLVPFLVGLGISRGVLDQAEDSVRNGGDLYVSGERFGAAAPVPLAVVDRLRAIPGVDDAFPRLVGEVLLGTNHESAVLVGLPTDRFPAEVTFVEGRLCAEAPAHELVVGSELARRLGLRVGSRIPPFYRNPRGERVSEVVGVFGGALPIWQAHVVLTPIGAAAAIFDEPGVATQVVVHCKPGYADGVRSAVLAMDSLAPDGAPVLRPLVVARDDLAAMLAARLLRREGLFALHLVLALAIGVPLLLVSTGLGLSEGRREAGLLKAVGWGTDEVLLRSFVESVVLAVAGASVSILVAVVWLRGFGGAGVAPVFLPGADLVPGFVVPFRLTPIPVLLSSVAALAITATGSLWSSWRAAAAPPADAMR